MLPEYLENLMKEYALLETEFQGAYEAQLSAEFGGEPFDREAFYNKILETTKATYNERSVGKYQQNFVWLLQNSIANLRAIMLETA